MNKGLKENTTQLTLNVGSLTSYINLSNIDSNLIFNYQNKNVSFVFEKRA